MYSFLDLERKPLVAGHATEVSLAYTRPHSLEHPDSVIAMRADQGARQRANHELEGAAVAEVEEAVAAMLPASHRLPVLPSPESLDYPCVEREGREAGITDQR